MSFTKYTVWFDRLLLVFILICLALPFTNLYNGLDKQLVQFPGYKMAKYQVFTLIFVNSGILLLLSLFIAGKLPKIYALAGFILALSALASAFGDTLFPFSLINEIGPVIPGKPSSMRFWTRGMKASIGQQIVRVSWILLTIRFVWQVIRNFKGTLKILVFFLLISFIALFLDFFRIKSGMFGETNINEITGYQTLSIGSLLLVIVILFLAVSTALRRIKRNLITGLLLSFLGFGIIIFDLNFTVLQTKTPRIGWFLAFSGWCCVITWHIWHLINIMQKSTSQ